MSGMPPNLFAAGSVGLSNILAAINQLTQVVGTLAQDLAPSSNVGNHFPLNPAGTASTTGVMMGLAVAFTPKRTGNVLVTICGGISNTTGGDGAQVSVYVGTGSAPANGATLVGVQTTGGALFIAASAGANAPFCVTGIASGLSLSVPIWIDARLEAVTGGTASLNNVTVSAVEV